MEIRRRASFAYYIGRNGMPGLRRLRRSMWDNATALVLIAILAGLLGGAFVGLATDHQPASPSSSASSSSSTSASTTSSSKPAKWVN